MQPREKIVLKEDLVVNTEAANFDFKKDYIGSLVNFTAIKEKKSLASELFEKEKWSELSEICAEIVKLQPNDCDNLFMFATSLAHLGELLNAAIVAEKLVNINPNKFHYRQLRNILTKKDEEKINQTSSILINETNLVRKKISLVTACMNRTDHLKESLPMWLKLPGLDEIIIVDWSNSEPLLELGDLDSRIKIIRVESEIKWILSYAYNIGVSNAKNEIIFKCDSDCIPNEEIFVNIPNENCFYAGYWKSGMKQGKASVNGQCLFLKNQFESVNGYSEYIRTYGRDDEDFYDRLILTGLNRKEIVPQILNFIDHTNEMRVGNQFKSATNPQDAIYRSTAYNEMYNYYIGKNMTWQTKDRRAKYIAKKRFQNGSAILNRIKEFELTIPDKVQSEAEIFSLRYMLKTKKLLDDNIINNLGREDCIKKILNS